VPTVSKFWEPQHPAALRVCPDQYRDCFYNAMDQHEKKHKSGMLSAMNPTLFSTFINTLLLNQGPLMVAQWLRYCATNRKVSGSIPDDVIGNFH
jgi:hypothetical protein